MIELHYYNQTRTNLPITDFKQLVLDTLPKFGITDNVEIELKFVGKTTMHQLNQQHRGKNKPTDVLSFPIWSNLKEIQAQNQPILLGSIVICLPVAKQDAIQEGISLKAKINFLIEHSLLHLMGFHHEGDN